MQPRIAERIARFDDPRRMAASTPRPTVLGRAEPLPQPALMRVAFEARVGDKVARVQRRPRAAESIELLAEAPNDVAESRLS